MIWKKILYYIRAIFTIPLASVGSYKTVLKKYFKQNFQKNSPRKKYEWWKKKSSLIQSLVPFGRKLRKVFIIIRISVVFGEYKISVLDPFSITSFGLNGGHIVDCEMVSFFAARRMQTRMTANTMGITISNTVTPSFLFCRSQFFHSSKTNCLPTLAIVLEEELSSPLCVIILYALLLYSVCCWTRRTI